MPLAANILILDDEAGIRFSLQEALSNDGHQVTAVASGEKALEAIRAQMFDLALIDLVLPGIDGLDVLHTLVQESPDTAVIVLTAHGSLETAIEALRQGAHDYLTKPCKIDALRESVQNGLEKRRQTRQEDHLLHTFEQNFAQSLSDLQTKQAQRVMKLGDMKVDFKRHIILLADERLDLSATQFGMLAHMVAHAPRVISAQELVREVQGEDRTSADARETVRYHIYRIRQKIKAVVADADIIQTVRGKGYRISPALMDKKRSDPE